VIFRILLLGAVAAGLFSCSLVPDPRPSTQLVLATWNVQNLFDEVDDGGEYPEFDPGRGWTRAQFWQRCLSLSRVIRTLGEKGPDILVLEELEGSHALEVLNKRFLSDLGYSHSFVAPDSIPGVKTGILSRFPLVRTGLHFPSGGDTEELRPLVEAEFDLGGRALVVLGNHWKSRIPTPRATEKFRLESAQMLRGRLTALDNRADRPLVIALGDFNTSLELSKVWEDRALLSGTSEPNPDSGLVVFTSRFSAEKTERAGAVWEPWTTVSEPKGSYLYQGGWDRLDHIFITLASLRLADWQFASFQADAYAPEPQAYGPRTPDGVSDHFPLVMTLVRKQP